MVRVYHTFFSIQGESTFAGLPCFFIRLAGCPMRCTYCDSLSACESPGQIVSVDDLVDEAVSSGNSLVEVTGGEPLAQSETWTLLSRLCDRFDHVLLETGGGVSIQGVDPRVRIILDVKCPGSGMSGRMCLENFSLMHSYDRELKFVVSHRQDFEWAVGFVQEHRLEQENLLVSPITPGIEPAVLAEWVLDAPVVFRMQLQMHKLIWPNGGDDR